MKIFRLEINVDDYKGCHLKDCNLDLKLKRCFNKGCELDLPKKLFNFNYDEKSELPIGDVHECLDINAFIITKRCKDILSAKSKINVQYITFSDDFIILNNLEVLNALNKEKTVFEYFEEIITDIKEYHFIDYGYPPLFQVVKPNKLVQHDYFVTEEFIKIVEENDLKGFLFEEVWDSEKE